MMADNQADHDRGSATIVAALASVLLISLLWLGMQLGLAIITRHRAEGAADLAALAAAAGAPQGQSQACAKAKWVTAKMGALLVSCRVQGWDAWVEVRTPSPAPLPPFGAADGRARAGPAPR